MSQILLAFKNNWVTFTYKFFFYSSQTNASKRDKIDNNLTDEQEQKVKYQILKLKNNPIQKTQTKTKQKTPNKTTTFESRHYYFEKGHE